MQQQVLGPEALRIVPVARELRAKGRGLPLDHAPEPSAAPVDSMLLREDEEQLARAMESLPAHYHELLLYKFRLNLPNKEIAALLGIAPQSLCVYYQRALNLLRSKVKHAPVA